MEDKVKQEDVKRGRRMGGRTEVEGKAGWKRRGSRSVMFALFAFGR